MAYDEHMAERIRAALKPLGDFQEKKMFGGLSFMLSGHMCCGVDDHGVMVRVGPDAYDAALKERYARPFDITGKPLSGMVFVDFDGVASKTNLSRWLRKGVSFVEGLPSKSATKKGVEPPCMASPTHSLW